MNKKDLEALGLNADALTKAGLKPEVVEQIIVLHGKDIEGHKATIETMKGEAAGLQKQLEDAGKMIEGFKKLDAAGIQKQADEWRAKAEAEAKKAADTKAESEKQMQGLRFDHALEGALTAAGAKNAKAVKALLNVKDLKLGEDGSIVGLTDQLEKVQGDNDYLFEAKKPETDDTGLTKKVPQIVIGSGKKSVVTDATVEAARKAAGLPAAKE